ncbi:hypothetical protein [Frankia sp. CcWB2]
MTLTGSPCGSPGGWKAATYTGRRSGPHRSRAPSPSRALPTRRPGANWIPVRDTPANYSISVLDADGRPVETLTGWPTARLADEHAQTLPDIVGYRVVPLRRVNGP